MNAYEEHMLNITKQMRQDLVGSGFSELTTGEAVQETMDNLEGTALVVINSVCGCAAGQARPAVKEAVNETAHKPDHLFTVFAGQDKEATAMLRDYFPDVPPSSPSIALFKEGKLAYFIAREQIENSQMEQIKDHLLGVLDQIATK